MMSDVSTISGATTLDSIVCKQNYNSKGVHIIDSKLNVAKEATFNSSVSVDGVVSMRKYIRCRKSHYNGFYLIYR